jgi:periplasmic divalent cation tolerance protein
MDRTYAVVMTTVATEEQANNLAHSLVDNRLAACVQIQPIRSVYRWKGETCTEPEHLLLIKTAADRFDAIEQHIKAHHSYETPEIVQVPITAGSAEYLRWIDASLSDQAST